MLVEAQVKDFVKENKISQKLLAQKSGLTENALSLILNGKRKLTADEYISICDALCVPYERFVPENNQKAG